MNSKESLIVLEDLHEELERRAITLEMQDQRLIAVDPHDRLSPNLKKAIQTHRSRLISELQSSSGSLEALRQAIATAVVATDLEVIIHSAEMAYERTEITREDVETLAREAIARSRQIPATVEAMSLSDFAASGLILKIESKTIGEIVLWAADNALVCKTPRLVVYRAKELEELADRSPEELRCIHRVKKHLDAEVIDDEQYTK